MWCGLPHLYCGVMHYDDLQDVKLNCGALQGVEVRHLVNESLRVAFVGVPQRRDGDLVLDHHGSVILVIHHEGGDHFVGVIRVNFLEEEGGCCD